MVIDQLMWLTLCIYMESRGEPPETRIKVGHVVVNRSIRRKKSIAEVVTEPKQFSWYEHGRMPIIKNFHAWAECAESAKECLRQRDFGEFFEFADHFYDDSIDPPYWTDAMALVEKAGPFYFYRSLI